MNFTDHLIHRDTCVASKQIGRMGSRSGLHWMPGDQDRCNCGCLELLRLMGQAFGAAENGYFRNNDFVGAEEWERHEKRVAELLGSKTP